MKRKAPGRVQTKQRVLMLASVASMIDQFNMPNIRLLQEMGYEVHVACNFTEGNTCDAKRIHRLQKTLEQMQVLQHPWDCPRKIHPVKNCRKAYLQLRKLLDQYHFAWIHCHSPIGGALARVAAHERHLGVVYTAHGFHFYKGAPIRNWLLYYPVEKLLAYWTDVLITINLEDYRFAKRHLRAGKVCHIPGVGIDLRKFAAQPDMTGKDRLQFCKKYRIPENAAVLLSVGELNKGKNHRTVIRAMADLAQKNVYYIICGQGAWEKKLQRDAGRLGVGSRIRMPGFQEELRPFYQNADIFVLPSLREGLPAALMEAMAAGRPCAVSDIRGSRELILDSRVRFAPGHAKQLRKVLEDLLEDDAYRKTCGMRNQKRIRAYSQQAVYRQMKKIYQSVATGETSNAGNISSNGNV